MEDLEDEAPAADAQREKRDHTVVGGEREAALDADADDGGPGESSDVVEPVLDVVGGGGHDGVDGLAIVEGQGV